MITPVFLFFALKPFLVSGRALRLNLKKPAKEILPVKTT